MSKSGRGALLMIALGSSFLASLALAAGKTAPTVAVSRYSSAVASVPSGTQVTITGQGYKKDAQLALCIDGGNGCTYPRADQDGTFSEGRSLFTEGTRLIQVYEVSPSWGSQRLKAQTTCLVTP